MWIITTAMTAPTIDKDLIILKYVNDTVIKKVLKSVADYVYDNYICDDVDTYENYIVNIYGKRKNIKHECDYDIDNGICVFIKLVKNKMVRCSNVEMENKLCKRHIDKENTLYEEYFNI